MTEKEIQLLGFERQDEEYLYEHSYHYYTYTIAKGFEFISNSSDEVGEDGQWYVEFFESEPTIRFTQFGEVQTLINLIEKRTLNQNKDE